MKKADRTKTGIVFNIQKFSVNDGPGIRTVVFLKGCPLRCRWCSNPESQLSRVQILWDQKKCIGCGHCAQTCPNGAISIAEGKVHIDPAKCRGCRKCVMECPGHALKAEGERKSVDDVMKVVMQDLPFYEESGGGITLSGGEMLAQPEFAAELCRAAKEEGLNTCCETTGFAPKDTFLKVIENIDCILMDMKHWNPETHRKFTGVTNELPLQNMKLAIEMGKDVLPRIPVIPGFNSTLADAEGLSRRLQQVGAKRCQLLPFHQFGENKYHMLDRKYEYENIPALHREDLEEYRKVFLGHGIDAFF